jgi:hypothetical protein
MASLILRLGHIPIGVRYTTTSFDSPLRVVMYNAGGSSLFGYVQGDLFLDKVFLIQFFLFKPFW